MLLPPTWTAADGKEVWVYLPPPPWGCRNYTTPVLKPMLDVISNIEKRYKAIGDLKWKWGHIGYCTWGNMIRRNSNHTLNFMKDGKDKKKLCPTCRGKGHPWSATTWNGIPFKKYWKTYPNGVRILQSPPTEEYHPLVCEECKGSGMANVQKT